MKIVKYFAMMVAAAATLVGCGEPNTDIPGEVDGTFKVTPSATTIYADGNDAVTFSVTLNGEAVDAADVTAYDAKSNNIVPMEQLSFSTTTPGEYEFYFTYEDSRSQTIGITAVDAKFSKLDLSSVEGQEGLSVIATSTVFQRNKEEVFIIVRKDGNVVGDADKIKFYLDDDDSEISKSDFVMVDYVDMNDDLYTLAQYTPTEAGVRDIWVSYGSANTKDSPLRITAVDFEIPKRAIDTDPDNTSFKRRSLANLFSGTGCGFCPNMTAALKDLAATDQYGDSFVTVVTHSFNDTDPMYILKDYPNIHAIFGVNSYPTLVMDMGFSYENQGRATNKDNIIKYLTSNTHLTPSSAGISARTVTEGNTVLARVTVKAAEQGEYRVGAWLVEDNIEAPQTNGAGVFDYNFDIHEAALRIADSTPEGASSMRYRGYPLGTLAPGQMADHVFTMALKDEWVKENCRLVFFVTCGDQFRVTNAVETSSLNSSIQFEYK